MGVEDKLIKIAQREVSGSRTSNRYSYQKSWGLARMMEYHLAQDDYLIGFEYHDDIIILDKADAATAVEFYQVKTRTSAGSKWTVNSLTKIPKGENSSMLGKLYGHQATDFKDHGIKICFVSNKEFSFSKDSIQVVCATELETDDQNVITDALSKELSMDKSDLDLSLIYFEMSLLSLEETDTHLKGKVADFFEALDLKTEKIGAWMSQMLSEIKSRNDFPQEKIKSINDFKKQKAFSKKEVQSLLDKIKTAENEIRPLFSAALSILNKEGMLPMELLQITQQGNKLASEITDASNDVLQTLKDQIDGILEGADLQKESLSNVLIQTFTKMKSEHRWSKSLFPDPYVKALILWGYCERTSEVQESSKESQEEKS